MRSAGPAPTIPTWVWDGAQPQISRAVSTTSRSLAH